MLESQRHARTGPLADAVRISTNRLRALSYWTNRNERRGDARINEIVAYLVRDLAQNLNDLHAYATHRRLYQEAGDIGSMVVAMRLYEVTDAASVAALAHGLGLEAPPRIRLRDRDFAWWPDPHYLRNPPPAPARPFWLQ